MARLFFAGIKHSGKTTFASLIANEWGITFKDSDDLIMEHMQISDVRSFYKAVGKQAFMDSEYAVLTEYAENKDNFIIALGGGASDNKKLLSFIKARGRMIYLQRKEEDLLPVILKDGIPAFIDENDIAGSFHRIYSERDQIYSENADLTIELGPYRDKTETVKYIIEKLMEAGYGC